MKGTAWHRLCQLTNYEKEDLSKLKDRDHGLKALKQALVDCDLDPGFPQIIHVAGTKGKGSTVSFLERILLAQGQSVVSTLSPHLISPAERLHWQGEAISEQELETLLSKLIDVAEKRSLSFFESLILAAFFLAKQKQSQWLVLETGLGGLWDATNVCQPTATAITRIALDHQKVLGRGLAAIAEQKAGIIKDQVPCFTIEQKPAVAEVIRQKAAEKKAPLHVITNKPLDNSPLSEHQQENAALAVAVIEDLLKIKVKTLPEVPLPGRCQWIDDHLLIDGAHNAVSYRALAQELTKSPLKKHWIVGSLRDHAWPCLKHLIKPGEKIWTVPLPSARAIEPQRLAQQLGGQSQNDALKSIQQAWSQAKNEQSLVVVTGSMYLAGEALRVVHHL